MKRTGKSRWQGRDGQVVNVETRALEYYEDQEFKGYVVTSKFYVR